MPKYKYTFFGKVLPERARVGIQTDNSDPILINAYNYSIQISMAFSQVSAVVNSENEVQDTATLKNEVESHVRFLADLRGFTKAYGYDVEITSMVNPSGKFEVFGVGWASLTEAVGERPLQFGELISVANKSPDFRRAIADLREAIRMPWDTDFFAYRAIEKIRQAFHEPGDTNAKAWKRLRKSLDIERDLIEDIKNFSDPQRHGEAMGMSWEERLDVMTKAWKIVDKFTVYIAGK